MDYDKLARAIYDITGPAGNIEKAYNCMTRLRLTVKDEHFSKDDLAKLPGVMGINKSGDEWRSSSARARRPNYTRPLPP